MKRSEMLKFISDFIESVEYITKYDCDKILTLLENKGMLPPARVKATIKPSLKVSKIDKPGGVVNFTAGELYEILPVNEWDPE